VDPLLIQPAALEGTKIIELGDYLAASFAGSLLGDFGAEVIKVDLPHHVDNNRMIGGADSADAKRSPFFATMCRNKKSITLDVRKQAGRDLFLRILGESDVLIENFRPGTLEKWELGPDDLAKVNPNLIVLRISAFGQTGPDSHLPGVDSIAQAFSGISGLTGVEDGPPFRSGVSLADYMGGTFGALGVLVALCARHNSGGSSSGQVVDLGLYEPLAMMMGAHAVWLSRYGRVESRSGNSLPHVALSGHYETARGGFIAMSAAGDVLFARLARLIGHPEWVSDERFGSRADRAKNRLTLEGAMQTWLLERSAEEAVHALQSAEVPACKVNSVADLLESPQVIARRRFVPVHDAVYGDLPAPAPTPILSRTPGSIRSLGPLPGQDNEEIYGEWLRLGDREIERLTSAEVI
jgi:crotonobetainyl-CoA:carnitine CoA-transferase CaiB-like acyl-CoA transferase